MTIKKWIKQNTQDLSGKTIAITGSTGGLGNEICKILAELGASLILLNRNKQKTQIQVEELTKITPNVHTKFLNLDMENFNTLNSVVNVLKDEKIDVLILNAGAFNLKRKTTTLGYDNIFQINFLGPYFLTKKLLPYMNKNSKAVVVGSIAHRYTNLNENDLELKSEKNSQKIYGNSKRLLMFSLFELFKSQKNTKLCVTHPGITQTNITSNYPKILQPLIKIGMKTIYSSPKKACLSIVKGIFDETEPFTWIGPKRNNIWGYPKKQTLKTCSPEECAKIFEIAEKLYEKYEIN